MDRPNLYTLDVPPTKAEISKALAEIDLRIRMHVGNKDAARDLWDSVVTVAEMMDSYHADAIETWQWSLNEQINDLDRIATYTPDPTIRQYTDSIVSHLSGIVADLTA